MLLNWTWDDVELQQRNLRVEIQPTHKGVIHVDYVT